MRITDTSDLWWKTAVVYCLDVETFLDFNDDGCGDFEGLAHRMDYLEELGVTCLWLMPFYPTPGKDDGYDISDYYGVQPELGNLGDFVEMIRMAGDRGIRVIIDLVINHTSDQHPWFTAARSDPESPYRDYYVWRDTKPRKKTPNVFPDVEDGIWSYDEKAGQYYLHHFYSFQPDLNITNPKVRDEVAKIMDLWLQLGVSGFRVDAVPFLLDPTGVEEEQDALGDPLKFLRSLRAFLGRRSGDAIMLGEANLPRDEQVEYFGGDGADGLTMQFDFITMQNLFLSLARENPAALVTALQSRPEVSIQSQWANFVRNHDELTLDKLTDAEREEVFAAFGPEEHMQVYGRGIIRRLPPMLGGDPRRIRMVYSLMFSLPGTPVLFYGEEIGMGENLEAGDRTAVRTPMQWTAEKNGGFSDAPPRRLVSPVVTGPFGPEHVNVSDQRHDPDSLLNFIKRLAERYRASPEMGWGVCEVIEQSTEGVLVHTLTGEEGRMLAVHNFSSEPSTVSFRIRDYDPSEILVDLLVENRTVTAESDGSISLSMDGYGYRWLRFIRPSGKRLA
ncbi:trehalose synthase [Microbacteriaceae bacterium SG_E_30_P1]|uniref:Alpha-amylase n=1 Tax=Antiquaquibacter oligotrophicus TaxID=2880260 RepID=A0ABT6KNU6_9MICO|nr:alpha-amylase family protein [Antiquaquibacter oligotrophicus]MDH6181451.1 trehalose synthase [Antiquaquibacter oligotrophicus]UDF12858.1 alpha-amylase family protein [Antiquaquibacter oligotrophicus]